MLQPNRQLVLSLHQPKRIRTETDNERALAIAAELIHHPHRSPEENKLYALLMVLLEKFEQEFY